LGPNKSTNFVRYRREFVITVIVITEFDCIVKLSRMENSEKVVKCGSKRNFDVAFLSGENEIDRNEFKKKEKDKLEEEKKEIPLETTSSISKFEKLFTFEMKIIA
jgi:hypothetical protein